MIEEGKYTQRELFDKLNISQYIWTRRKEDWLEYFYDFCDYEYYQERYGIWVFDIKEVYIKEYIPLPRKNNTKEKMDVYEEFTLRYIKEFPYNSTALIARNAVSNKGIQNKYHHQPASAYRYIRPVVNDESKVNKGEKVWGYLSEDKLYFYPLNPQQEQHLKEILKHYLNEEYQADIMSQVENGDVTKEEAKELLYNQTSSRYIEAMNAFKEKWGVWPFKVSKLSLVEVE